MKNLVASGDFVVLDTETTGLRNAEVCQIAIVNSLGETLLDTLVQTKYFIPPDATRIHGITDEMVKDAPIYPDLLPQLIELLTGRQVVVYNATYDRGILHSTAEKWGLPKTEWKDIACWSCAMNAYAEHWGEWNDYHGSYRWQKLTVACQQQGLAIQNAHSALGDCLMTLALINKVWGME